MRKKSWICSKARRQNLNLPRGNDVLKRLAGDEIRVVGWGRRWFQWWLHSASNLWTSLSIVTSLGEGRLQTPHIWLPWSSSVPSHIASLSSHVLQFVFRIPFYEGFLLGMRILRSFQRLMVCFVCSMLNAPPPMICDPHQASPQRLVFLSSAFQWFVFPRNFDC